MAIVLLSVAILCFVAIIHLMATLIGVLEDKKQRQNLILNLQKSWTNVCRMYRRIAYRKYNGFMLLHSKEYDGYLIYDVDNDYTDIFYYDDIELAIVELNEKRNKYIKSNPKLRRLKV